VCRRRFRVKIRRIRHVVDIAGGRAHGVQWKLIAVA
jgi:hypothetical protein